MKKEPKKPAGKGAIAAGQGPAQRLNPIDELVELNARYSGEKRTLFFDAGRGYSAKIVYDDKTQSLTETFPGSEPVVTVRDMEEGARDMLDLAWILQARDKSWERISRETMEEGRRCLSQSGPGPEKGAEADREGLKPIEPMDIRFSLLGAETIGRGEGPLPDGPDMGDELER